jgi:hypothetical protein
LIPHAFLFYLSLLLYSIRVSDYLCFSQLNQFCAAAIVVVLVVRFWLNMDQEKAPYYQDPDQISGSGSDIVDQSGGIDYHDMHRLGKEQQFKVRALRVIAYENKLT